MRDTIIIEDLIVWPRDLGKMTWDETTKKVKKLGEGWRLPTKEEFETILYPNRSKIPNLKEDDFYWSSTEYNRNYAWTFVFSNGTAYYYFEYFKHYVRAVKTIDGEAALELLLKDF